MAEGEAIGIDVGGTKINSFRVARDGEILDRKNIPTPADDAEAVLAQMAAALADLHPPLEPALWAQLRTVLQEYADEHGSPPRLRALLAGAPLPAKANLLTRPTLTRQDAPCPRQGRSEHRGEEVPTALCVAVRP